MIPSFLTAILWSMSAVCATQSTRLLGGALANLVRLSLATLLLALWGHVCGQGLAGAGFWFFVLSGVVGFGLGDVALYEAYPRIGSRLTLLLAQCLAAPVGAVIEWFWLGTTLSVSQIIAGLAVLMGVAIALAPQNHVHFDRRHLFAGVVFGVLSAIGQGSGAVLSRKAYQVTVLAGQTIDGGTAAYQRILGGLAIAGGFFLLVNTRDRSHRKHAGVLANDETDAVAKLRLKAESARHAEPMAPTKGETTIGAGSRLQIAPTRKHDTGAKHRWRAAWPWVLFNTLTGPVVGVTCYQWALATTPSGIVLPIVATTPLAVIPLAYKLEGDKPRLSSLIGGVIAVAGAVALTIVK